MEWYTHRARAHGSLRQQLFDLGQAAEDGERALAWLPRAARTVTTESPRATDDKIPH